MSIYSYSTLLSVVNGERALMGATTISELEMERGIEDFEKQCWEKINITLRNNEAQEDQDDSIICDVCRSVRLFLISLKHTSSDEIEKVLGKCLVRKKRLFFVVDILKTVKISLKTVQFSKFFEKPSNF